MTGSDVHHEPDSDEGGFGPYLFIIATALVIGLGLAAYLIGYRREILAILTQSPT